MPGAPGRPPLGGFRVAGVAAYEAPWNDDPAVQRPWEEYLAALDRALEEGRRGDAASLFMRYVGTPAEQIEGMRQAPFWTGFEAIAPTLRYDHAGVIGPSMAVPAEVVSGIDVPVLALCGGASMPFMCLTARTIAQRSRMVGPSRWRVRRRGGAGRPGARTAQVLRSCRPGDASGLRRLPAVPQRQDLGGGIVGAG